MGFEADSEDLPFTAEQEAELRRVATEEAASDLADLDLAQAELDRFYALPTAARAAIHLEKYELAGTLATEMLELAPAYREDWNYGNAIHHAHTVLGLVALLHGNVDQAQKHLLASGSTPGSPQLDTFGPTMELARALMRAGFFESIAEYLHLCRAFWKMGNNWLDVWDEMVAQKKLPNCFMHAYR